MSQSKPSVLVVAGSHGGQTCGPVIHERLVVSGQVTSTLHKEPQSLAPADFGAYDAVVYYGENSNFTRDFGDEAEQALRELVRGGRGLVGVHVASYRAEGRLDALFGGNSPGCVRPPADVPSLRNLQFEFDVRVVDREHPVTAGVRDFRLIDEHYRSELTPDARVLLRGDDALGGQPLGWLRTDGGGRVFHTPLGHRPDDFGHPQFWRLILQGVLWAAGR